MRKNNLSQKDKRKLQKNNKYFKYEGNARNSRAMEELVRLCKLTRNKWTS